MLQVRWECVGNNAVCCDIYKLNISMAEIYKQYVDYITAGGVAETAYLVARNGAICATNLPIQTFPVYNFEIEDEKDPSIKKPIVVNEGEILLEAVAHQGRPKHPAGIRLYNQKYYLARYDPEQNLFYLKKEKGGACIAVTKTYIIIGTFNVQAKMQNGVTQNPGELNKRVEGLAKTLIAQGY